MTGFGEIFSIIHKKHQGIWLNIFGWAALWLWLALASPATGQGAAAANDWVNLAPPPGTTDTNTFPTDIDYSNVDTSDTAELPSETNSAETNDFTQDLAMARYYRKMMQPEKAEPILLKLLAPDVDENIQKRALLEMAAAARDENDPPRAQTIYAQFLNRWPDDAWTPEVYLRQGEVFRQIGLTDLALSKFYSVMGAALALKNGQLPYYQKLVLETQVEIAETHYLMGHFVDSADFYSRLLENPDPALNRPQMQFRLVRSLAIIGRNDEAASRAQDFLSRFPNSDEAPEVRYYLAQALKALGRGNEALQQVLLCLQQQKSKTGNDEAVWTYWQQRIGNELGNQLYQQGDYVHALEIYVDLAQLDSSAAWQVPVYYQMGLTYEKLAQPQKAADTYNQLLARETEVGTNATPGLKAIFDMARWRTDFLKWQTNAQVVNQSLSAITSTEKAPPNSTTNITQ